MEESPDVSTQMVIEDYQRGYVLNERVLRHAKVKVAMPVSNAVADSKTSTDSTDGEEKTSRDSDMENSTIESIASEESGSDSSGINTEQQNDVQEKE
jgi:GrpE protein